MKIAYILPALAPGGAERVTIALASHAAQAGHDVTLFLAWPAPGEEPLRRSLAPEVSVEYLMAGDAGRLGRLVRGAVWWARRPSRFAAFDVVHVHLTFSAVVGTLIGWWRRLAGREGPALVETYHAVGTPVAPAMKRLHRFMASRRDAFVLMADHPDWDRFARDHPRIITATIQNGAEDPRVEEIPAAERLAYRRRIGLPDAGPVVGTVGRLSPDRQPWMYLPIFEAIGRAIPDAHFVLAGGGREEQRLKSMLATHGLEGRVHITGTVPEPRFPLSILDAYITMNVGPVSGLAGIEAALAGVPVVAIQLQSDYRQQPSDWIWSHTDSHAIAQRVIALLRDPGLRSETVRQQREHARQHFTNDVMWSRYEQIYRCLAPGQHT